MKTPKLLDIQINAEMPFQNCKLKREQYADNLTQLLTNYSDGFVLAINNSWGSGKTTFVKMWINKLNDKKFKTVYFNAWENDFENDALAAILGEVKPLFESKNEALFLKLKKSASILGKNLLPILVGSIASKVFDSNTAGEITKGLTDGSMELFQQSIDTYQKKKESLSDFKVGLQEMVDSIRHENDKPLVIFIDEIDRCRPDYAVEVLEKVKHLFSVPGIVFVISIDKAQLCHAIRGVYGSEQINAEEYLKRFIDVEFTLPDPEIDDLNRYLYEYFEFGEILGSGNSESNEFWSFSKWLFQYPSQSIRTVEKLYCQTKLAISTAKTSYHFPSLVLLLLYLKNFQPGFYQAIVRKELNCQELSTKLFNIFRNRLNKNAPGMFVRVHAQLIVIYARQLVSDPIKLLFNTEETLNIQEDYDNSFLASEIKEFAKEYNTEQISITDILKMIELSERFKI